MMTLVTKRAMIAIGAGVAVIFIAYLALRGDGTTSTTAAATQAPALAPPPAIVTPPAPVAAPTPAAVPVAAPELVHVPIVSRPAGATVTLLDNGNAQVIGRTPTEVAVDPARNYDVVVALAKHPTKIAHLDPSSTPQLTVDLNQAAPQPVIAAKPQPVVAAKPQPVVAAKPLAPAQPVRPQHVTTAAPHPVAAAAPVAGRGVLMISSKPPCEIVVDGKSTHLMTPQRSLPLAPGHHQVALLNPQQKIKRTLDVQIDANHPTKVIQDFTKK
jgi:hypothetical protein